MIRYKLIAWNKLSTEDKILSNILIFCKKELLYKLFFDTKKYLNLIFFIILILLKLFTQINIYQV